MGGFWQGSAGEKHQFTAQRPSKKNSCRTRYGKIEIAKSHAFSKPVLGSRTSPLLQEKLALLGIENVFKGVPAIVESLLGIAVNESQVYRITQAVGEAVDKQALQSPSAALEAVQRNQEARVYGMVDGSMLFTDEGWQECKVGRVFKADVQTGCSPLQWRMEQSEYVAHKGHWREFATRFEELLPPQSRCEQVFVSDGALWLSGWLSGWLRDSYPEAVHILDFFHVLEKLALAGDADWLGRQKARLLNGEQQAVRRAVARSAYREKDKLLAYLKNNACRMNYKEYREKGMMISSGPIESAHRTLLQVRMKRSGQRWSEEGCERMAKLRVASKSEKPDLISQIFMNHAA